VSEPVVLDASAILTVINGEPGQDDVIPTLPYALVSAVNLSEVVAKLADRGMPADAAYAATVRLGFAVVPLDPALARAAGALRPLTRAAGLSLGDRCCLALAQHKRAMVLTTDRAWSGLGAMLDVLVRNVRPGD
jgi:PIN domain nuclease of toxin-antitoxin system